MPINPVVGERDGGFVSISDVLGAPTYVNSIVSAISTQDYLMETLLRPVQGITGAGIAYRESENLFLNSNPELIPEFGEIPVVTSSRAQIKLAALAKWAFAVEVSQEMRDDNRINFLDDQITRAMNTFERYYNQLFFQLFSTNATIPVTTVANVWSDGGAASKPRQDILRAKQVIQQATVDGTSPYGFTGGSVFGFVPDTIVMSVQTATDLELNSNFYTPFQYNPATNPLVNGDLATPLYGMQVVQVNNWPDPTKVLLLQKNIVGGYGDARSLGASPWMMNPLNEAYRSNIVRRTGLFIDQPYAACWLAGVHS